MYKGVFHGDQVDNCPVKILILGESHHKEDDSLLELDTESVVRNYLNGADESCYKFFEKIVKSFGFSDISLVEEKQQFWDKVYFGNYIDEICGVGDDRALIKIYGDKGKNTKGNRCKYNDQLFSFINNHNIDFVFCFSRRVYGALPSFANKSEEILKPIEGGIIKRGENQIIKDEIFHCKYLKNIDHMNTSEILNKDLEVYCMRHPSGKGGYNINNYSDKLNKIIKNLLK